MADGCLAPELLLHPLRLLAVQEVKRREGVSQGMH